VDVQLPTQLAQQKTSQIKATPKDGKVQSATTLKVKVQQPTPAEPIRIRVVPVRPDVVPKAEQPAASASSGGRPPSKGAPRVGKVKLRLKPASSSPMEMSAGSLEKGVVAASQSPVSVQANVKPEPMPEETSQSRHGIQEVKKPDQHVKEEVATPVLAEEGEIESADLHALTRKESANSLSEALSHVIQGIGGAGVDSSKGSPIDGLFDGSDRDGTESPSQISHRPNSVKHENGEGDAHDIVSQLHSKPQETNLKPVHTDTAAGSLEASDTKPAVPSTSDAPQGKEREKKKEKKDKKDRKHKKDKKKHSKDKDEDSQNQDKKRTMESDIEYQERKRKRKEQKDQKREKEGRKSQKLDVNTKKPVKVEEIASVPAVSTPDGDLGQKIRLKIMTIHTAQSRP
jgi:hypothetical protein